MQGEGKEEKVVPSADTFLYFDLHKALIEQLMKVIVAHRDLEKGRGIDPVKFQRLQAIIMADAAAVLAVDCNMTDNQFVSVCGELYKAAYQRAPKWG